MTILDALTKIKDQFNVNQIGENLYKIETNVLIDEFNFAHIVLRLKDNKAYLSDYGTTLDLINLDNKILSFVCLKNKLENNNGFIECEYTDNLSILNMLDCITQLSQIKNK